MKTAHIIGIAPDVFWQLTPWQMNVYTEGFAEYDDEQHNKKLWFLWHGAAFARAAKLPSLPEIMRRKKQPVQADVGRDIMRHLKAYQAKREKHNDRSKNQDNPIG